MLASTRPSYSMGTVLILITQLQNLTGNQVGFRVPHGLHQIRDLPSGRTRIVKQHRVLRLCRGNGPDWTVGVFIDGKYMGVELNSSHLLKSARIIFRYVGNVLVVEGIKENFNSDYLLRLRYFGWMRNIFWDKRPRVEIARSDSTVATKLRYFIDVVHLIVSIADRGIEAIDTATQRPHRQTAPLAREAEKLTRKIPVYYSSQVLGNYSNARTSFSSRFSLDSVNTNTEKHEKNNIYVPYVMDKSRDKLKVNTNTDGKLNHVNNAVPPPQPHNERIPWPPRPNMNELVMDSPENYMDGFVNGLLFGFALVFVVFVRVWIG